MKIAVVGGGGWRTPLLLKGMVDQHGRLPVSDVVLFDPATDKLALLEPVCRALLARAGDPFRLWSANSLEEALEGAAFVITSIRPGGLAARAADERLLLDRGLLGQESVGAAGFALALRTIPPMLEIAQAVAQRAPSAWIINLTNPVGIVTEAVRKGTRALPSQARIIGICDRPIELFEGIAQALRLPVGSLHFDYFGLNHLGWIRAILNGGTDRLPQLLQDGTVEPIYGHKLFEAEFLRNLGVLPSDYLYYYYRTEAAVANLRRAPESRAQVLERMHAGLWENLAHSQQPLETYERYLQARNATAGYDRVAVAVMAAIHGDTHAVLPVDVENRGAIESLEDDDVVEVPSVIGLNGAFPLATGRPPASVSNLLHLVKNYERMTVRAALTGSVARAVQALASNPLIRRRDLAAELLAEFRGLHRELLGYLH